VRHCRHRLHLVDVSGVNLQYACWREDEHTLGEALSCALDTICSSDSGSESRKSGNNIRLHRTTMRRDKTAKSICSSEGMCD
jgi:hypothetical protein